ncbi:hypothetical protein BDV36DRAFT_199381 [Aspergillus pseudocaelatus]|uniref:Uncharacterized protein n=1 Tax=Aspergillus pseudocaelatus TaxID=1825620 RepID=A0ABQ6WHY4_9EURO|nr:hypothetical protein BDV36DRAFT_199381 [Aspergillus pseudocaelatus]
MYDASIGRSSAYPPQTFNMCYGCTYVVESLPWLSMWDYPVFPQSIIALCYVCTYVVCTW